MPIEIYTDGACSGNPGPGGWGALLIAQKNGQIVSKKEIYGGEQYTTNNRMELMAAIKALDVLKKTSEVTIVTDSKYLKDGMTKWLNQWLLNNWKNSAKKTPARDVHCKLSKSSCLYPRSKSSDSHYPS